MTNIILNGCNGKMGKVITRIAESDPDCKIIAGIDICNYCENDYPVYTSAEECTEKADVIVDFSHPSAFSDVLELAIRTKTPLIAATTGLSKEQHGELAAAAEKIPVFFSANMSIGINLLTELSKKAAALLDGSFDIEILEKHHNQKIDAPSGTALAIADAISDVLQTAPEYVYDRHSVRRKRSPHEIGIHSVRGGTIVGEHEVIFAGVDEVIELKHTASSKEVFAVGAIRAAKFMTGKPKGMYSMSDIIADLT